MPNSIGTHPNSFKMKYLIKIGVQCLPILFSIILVSCNSSSNKPQETPQQSQQTESTGQIVDNHVNTLTTAPDKAKKAVDAEMPGLKK